MGTRTASQERVQSGYELRELCRNLHSRYEKPPERKHLAHEGAYYPNKNSPVFQRQADRRDTTARYHSLAE